MAKRKIVVGNWKMNPQTEQETEKWFKDIVLSVRGIKKTEIVICAPFLYLAKLRSINQRTKKITLGAQDALWGDTGPFTGGISPVMLYNIGVRYVILGHSEKRALGEDNSVVNKKIKAALASGLVPILCVGESVRDENHEYFNLMKEQIGECLRGVSKNSISKVIIAYEPIWAISSTLNRRDATAEDSKEMAIFIRKIVSELSTPEIAKETRIIYGGSVSERDAEEFLKNGGVDGVLSGKASLDPQKFSQIVKICEALKN